MTAMKYFGWIICICLLPRIAFAGLTDVQRKSQFEKALGLIIAAATPQKASGQREKMIKDYMESRPNKGFSIEPISSEYWRSSIHDDHNVTGDRTLEGCQMRYGKPCALIAVNDDLAYEGELTTKDMVRLKYTGKFDTGQIPIIRSVTRKRADVQNYDLAMLPKAMVIHPWGKIFISAGNDNAKEAQETALAKCNNDQDRNGKDGPCYVYAVNNDVVIAERRTTAK
jgi:hypothetical protein